jgi:hypothetical protein
MNDIELGWFVGIIDGEGSIQLDKRNKYSRQPVLSVASTDIEILNECKRITGAGCIVQKPSKNTKHKLSYTWRMVGAKQILKLLTKMLPYLKCPKKARRAKFLIDNYTSVTSINGNYTDEMKIRKLKFEEDFFNQ